MASPFWDRHRGPFQFMLSRAHKKKKPGFSSSEWLQSSTRDGREATEEAWALLDDPRDTIEAVYFYSLSEQQFVGAVRRTDDRITSGSAALGTTLRGSCDSDGHDDAVPGLED